MICHKVAQPPTKVTILFQEPQKWHSQPQKLWGVLKLIATFMAGCATFVGVLKLIATFLAGRQKIFFTLLPYSTLMIGS